MIDQKELAIKRPAPYVVNIGRVEVVDRDAVILAFENRKIRGFALDVPYGGTGAADGMQPFTRFDNTLVSPHRAGTLRGQSPHLYDIVENYSGPRF